MAIALLAIAVPAAAAIPVPDHLYGNYRFTLTYDAQPMDDQAFDFNGIATLVWTISTETHYAACCGLDIGYAHAVVPDLAFDIEPYPDRIGDNGGGPVPSSGQRQNVSLQIDDPRPGMVDGGPAYLYGLFVDLTQATPAGFPTRGVTGFEFVDQFYFPGSPGQSTDTGRFKPGTYLAIAQDHSDGVFPTLTISALADAPEPAIWMMYVGGFGLIGIAIRRRRMIAF